MKKLLASILSVAAVFVFAVTAHAASGYTLDGTATEANGEVTIFSDATSGGSISFDVPTGLTFSELDELSTDMTFTQGTCGGGSPRFTVGIDTDGDSVTDGYMPVYIGDYPNFDACTDGNTGNLLDSTDARFDLSQLGGAFYSTYADAVTLVGDDAITEILFVVDGGWKDVQEVVVDNTVVHTTDYDYTAMTTPTSKDQCKNGGWMTFNNPTFKNQGQCVSYVQANPNAGKQL